MDAKVIKKKRLQEWLNELAERLEVIAPVREDGVTRFQVLGGACELDLDATPAKSLREHFTPETEPLFEYESCGQAAELADVPVESRERLIFGARACDAAALKYVDAVYSNVEPADALYFARRNRTALIGLFCDKPSWSCFCTELGDFLTNPQGLDAYFTHIGEKLYAEALTPRGEELLHDDKFEKASDEDAQAVEAVRRKTMSRLPSMAHAPATQSTERDWEHSLWVELARKCLGCGVCSYLCPTCHCFDIQEQAMGSRGIRFRCWDTCQFEKFTLMGAGHNPRPTKKERTRQRVFHKFVYSPERYGILGCVGCGRCIAACPVNIDIRRVMLELAPGGE